MKGTSKIFKESKLVIVSICGEKHIVAEILDGIITEPIWIRFLHAK